MMPVKEPLGQTGTDRRAREWMVKDPSGLLVLGVTYHTLPYPVPRWEPNCEGGGRVVRGRLPHDPLNWFFSDPACGRRNV